MIPSTPSPKPDEVSDRRRPPALKNSSMLRPDKNLPEHTADKVRKIAKKRLPDHDKVAAELAPLLGLGNDLLASQRAACLFKHRGVLEGVAAFESKYLDAEGLNAPLPEWRLVCQMLLPTRTWSSSSSSSSSSPPTPTPTREPLEKKGVVEVWTRPEYPDLHTLGGWDVNYHYARFVARTLAVVRDPLEGGSQLVHWVRDAKAEDAWWVLFHALLYLQFETMRERIRNAPLRQRIMAMMRPS
ncbi:hypothetical protein PG988_010335 [Apiospora saccharicola]